MISVVGILISLISNSDADILGNNFIKNGYEAIKMTKVFKTHTIACEINGKKVRMFVDTGSVKTCVDPSLLKIDTLNWRPARVP